jgi:hypothetical protein
LGGRSFPGIPIQDDPGEREIRSALKTPRELPVRGLLRVPLPLGPSIGLVELSPPATSSKGPDRASIRPRWRHQRRFAGIDGVHQRASPGIGGSTL